jgi:hypothetical protein
VCAHDYYPFHEKPAGSTLSVGGLAFDWHLLDDFHVEALEGGDVGGGVGEKADFVDAEVGENLAAETHLAKNALMLAFVVAGPGLALFRGEAGFAMEDDAVRIDGAVDVESAAGVVQVDEGAASGLGYLSQ